MAGICTQPVSGSMIPVHVQPDIVVRQQSDVPVARFLGRGAGARGQPERAGSIGSRARAFAFVAKAGSAPRVVRAQVRQTVRLLKSSLAMPPRADRLRMASHRELVAECRRLFRASRQDYGVPIAGQVARIGACLERLCALQGDASTVTRTALMHGVVARALGTRAWASSCVAAAGWANIGRSRARKRISSAASSGCEGAGSRAPAHCPKPGAQDGRG